MDLGIQMQKHPVEDNVVSIWMDGRETHANLEPNSSFKGKITITDDEFSIDARDVEVNVRPTRKQTTSDDNRNSVHIAIKMGAETRTQIMRETNLSDATVRTHIATLIEEGYIIEEDNGPGKPKHYKEAEDE